MMFFEFLKISKTNKNMHNNNILPTSVDNLFENGETEYIYFSHESMDNYWSMDWFIKHLSLSDFITIHDGTQINVKHPCYEKSLQIDAGGLGDFYSHNFIVTIIK